MTSASDHWPVLPYREWKDTCATLHLWTQIIGKIRLVQTPWVNHSWHTTLYLTSRGLTTSVIPYGLVAFQIDFDFIDHKLLIQTSEGAVKILSLASRSVADFHHEVIAKLDEVNLKVKIVTTPNELVTAIPFEKDYEHATYEAEHANRFWRTLLQADRVLKQFRARFIGKCSPVHFFWGGFDLAVTRFSGRRAPQHAGGIPHLPDWITREAYSHEVSSCGFWPGNDQMPEAIFYSYAYPEPPGFAASPVRPEGAAYHSQLREFVFPYNDVRKCASPDEALLEFLQTSYEAAADNAGWDRSELERNDHSRK